MRQTPLWATDWSIVSSSAKDDFILKVTLPSFLLIAATVAASSTMPENIYINFKCGIFNIELNLLI